jgi:hypothetical protein
LENAEIFLLPEKTKKLKTKACACGDRDAGFSWNTGVVLKKQKKLK